MKTILAAVAFLLTLASTARPTRAEVFVLRGGGRVVGQWINRDETPRRQYVVQVADGAKLAFDAAQVEKVLRPRDDETEYERIRPTYADTAAAQWELAQWCIEHRLTAQREVHARRVIELDPEHDEARHALGYSRVDGQWATRDEVMIARGYQRYKNKWMLPQEIELLENKQKSDSAQQKWCQDVKRWRGWLGGDRDQQARDNIRSINDPLAVKALAIGLGEDSDPRARILLVETLGKINTFEAAMALAKASILDGVEELRLTCLDHLQTQKRPEVVAYFVGKLNEKKNNNETINLAGIALGRMKDPSAIGPLIDSLVTAHKYKIVKPGGEGAMSSTFSKGPGGLGSTGLSAGGGPKYVIQPVSNQAVLDALIALTRQNFGFDKQVWKRWYAAQRKPAEVLDARRD
jgi:hypothetical protein